MGTRKNSRTDKLAADQALIDGITKDGAKLPPSFPLEGQQTTPAGVAQVLQGRIATGKAVVAADTAHKAAVKADRAERAKTGKLVRAFVRLLVAMFAEEAGVLGDFGVEPPKEGQRSSADKAKAAEKNRETRKVLGTKGSRQKKAALAEHEAQGASPAPAAPEAAQPAPAPAPNAKPAS